MSEELKPCPFCGGEAHGSHEDYGDTHYWRVYCNTVGCAFGISKVFHSEAEAIAAWNTRVERKPTDLLLGMRMHGGHAASMGRAELLPELRKEGGGRMTEFITEWMPDSHKYKEEIVRCRDCKHLVTLGSVCAYWDYGEIERVDGFCAWGERSEK